MPGGFKHAAVLAAVVIGILATIAGCAENRSPAPYLAVVTTDDAQSRVLAQIYATVVRATGVATQVRLSADPVAELDTGTASIAPGLTGTLLRQFAPQQRVSGDEETTYRAMIAVLPAGVAAADYGTAADDPALAAANVTVARWPEPSLANATRHCDLLARSGQAGAVGPPVRQVSGCGSGQPRQYGSTDELFAALRRGEITVAWTTTANPALPAEGITLLTDQKEWLPANNVVPVYRRNELTEPQVLSLNKVAGELTTDDLAAMTRAVSRGADPAQPVDNWLGDHQILVR